MTGSTLGQGSAADRNSDAAFPLRDIARAKVNLTLEILGRRADGYHELRSLVAFTRFGDALSVHPGKPFSLQVDGPFASALDGGNLVQAAAELYAKADLQPYDVQALAPESADAARGSSPSPTPEGTQPYASLGAFRLEKRIPVAAGLGGGSADAAAALRLLAGSPTEASRLRALLPLAAKLGADVPVCVFSQAAIMTGVGERLSLIPVFPPLPILLVNPRAPLSTAAVFRELRSPALSSTAENEEPVRLSTIDDVVRHARLSRNDLQAPAARLLPVIGDMLSRMQTLPGALLARLSGSGPTCFALFRAEAEAEAAALHLRDEQPEWWAEATTLG